MLGLLGAGTAALALGACGGSSDDPAGGGNGNGDGALGLDDADLQALDGRTLRVAAFDRNHAAGPLYWPQFAPPGLNVEVTTLSSGNDMNTALEAGNLDFAIFGLVNGLIQAEGGIGSKIVCMGAERGAALIVASDGPAQSVADLRGQRIGFQGPSFQFLLLLQLLDEAGLDPEADVELVRIDYNDMPAALAAGDVAAYSGSEPNPARSLADGTGRALPGVYDTALGSFNSAIWAARRIADEDRAMVRAATRMQRAAAELLTLPDGGNDPEVWRDLTVTQFGYDPEVYEALLPNVGALWNFDDERRSQLEAFGSSMLDLGLLSAEPDYEGILDLADQPEA